ncbi:hypothetical protein O3P69_005621 [Scylla paramamosain]|uniref:Uncharacterized protein n=1 Tax=Scylla paramamosain TaxID=85552 RepID=A0AAW0U6J1_SCYPA
MSCEQERERLCCLPRGDEMRRGLAAEEHTDAHHAPHTTPSLVLPSRLSRISNARGLSTRFCGLHVHRIVSLCISCLLPSSDVQQVSPSLLTSGPRTLFAGGVDSITAGYDSTEPQNSRTYHSSITRRNQNRKIKA